MVGEGVLGSWGRGCGEASGNREDTGGDGSCGDKLLLGNYLWSRRSPLNRGAAHWGA